MSDQKQHTGSLLTEALEHVSSLVRKEVNLARTEMSENLNKAIGALISLAVALVFAIVALNTLSAAIVGWVANGFGLSPAWASLIVAAVFAIIASALIIRGKKALQARSLAPTRTTHSLHKDAESVKEAYK